MSGGPTDPADAGDLPIWSIRGGTFDLRRPLILGVLNVTPDSFSDGGVHLDPRIAARRAEELAEEGADLVDIGAESTRPGAPPVSVEEEWSRLEPVLRRLQGSLPVPISVDTTKAEVAARALELGAAAINDVSGLRAEPAIAVLAAETGAGLIVMHMRGDPRTMQRDVEYEDLIGEIRASLAESLSAAERAGCEPSQTVVDPGIGFGKSPEGSLRLLARLGELRSLGRPIMVGPSRKSFIGNVLELSVEERLEATIAACVVALERGAHLFRVHDVRALRRALDMANSIQQAGRMMMVG
ncbi:MAG: dihydropteroate synthase [Gemmatimonadota bacterium]